MEGDFNQADRSTEPGPDETVAGVRFFCPKPGQSHFFLNNPQPENNSGKAVSNSIPQMRFNFTMI
jgi:hypothetical protein